MSEKENLVYLIEMVTKLTKEMTDMFKRTNTILKSFQAQIKNLEVVNLGCYAFLKEKFGSEVIEYLVVMSKVFFLNEEEESQFQKFWQELEEKMKPNNKNEQPT